MPDVRRREFDTDILYQSQAKTGYVVVDRFAAPAAASASGVMAARTEAAKFLAKLYSFTVTSANATAAAVYSDANGNQWTVVATIAPSTTLVLTAASGTPPASGTLTKVSGTGDATITFSSPGSNLISQPDMPRVVTVTGTGGDGDAAGDVVVKGTNIRDQAVTDTITLNGKTTVAGVVAFKTITSIDFTGVTALDADAHVEVGTGVAFGRSRIMITDKSLCTVQGTTQEATKGTFAVDATIGKNTVTFTASPNGVLNFDAVYVTIEQTTAA